MSMIDHVPEPLRPTFCAATHTELSHSDAVLAHSSAEEDVLADMDTFSDWIGALCMRTTVEHTRIGHVPRSAENFANYVDALDEPQLLSLVMNATQPAQVFAAREALRDKYLKHQATWIAQKTSEHAANLLPPVDFGGLSIRGE